MRALGDDTSKGGANIIVFAQGKPLFRGDASSLDAQSVGRSTINTSGTHEADEGKRVYLLAYSVVLWPIRGIFTKHKKGKKINKKTIIGFLKLCFYIFIHLSFYSLNDTYRIDYQIVTLIVVYPKWGFRVPYLGYDAPCCGQ
jgi:hypothetical protein